MDDPDCSFLDDLQKGVLSTLGRLYSHIPMHSLVSSIGDKIIYQSGVDGHTLLNRCIDELETQRVLKAERDSVIDLTKSPPNTVVMDGPSSTKKAKTESPTDQIIVIPEDSPQKFNLSGTDSKATLVMKWKRSCTAVGEGDHPGSAKSEKPEMKLNEKKYKLSISGDSIPEVVPDSSMGRTRISGLSTEGGNGVVSADKLLSKKIPTGIQQSSHTNVVSSVLNVKNCVDKMMVTDMPEPVSSETSLVAQLQVARILRLRYKQELMLVKHVLKVYDSTKYEQTRDELESELSLLQNKLSEKERHIEKLEMTDAKVQKLVRTDGENASVLNDVQLKKNITVAENTKSSVLVSLMQSGKFERKKLSDKLTRLLNKADPTNCIEKQHEEINKDLSVLQKKINEIDRQIEKYKTTDTKVQNLVRTYGLALNGIQRKQNTNVLSKPVATISKAPSKESLSLSVGLSHSQLQNASARVGESVVSKTMESLQEYAKPGGEEVRTNNTCQEKRSVDDFEYSRIIDKIYEKLSVEPHAKKREGSSDLAQTEDKMKIHPNAATHPLPDRKRQAVCFDQNRNVSSLDLEPAKRFKSFVPYAGGAITNNIQTLNITTSPAPPKDSQPSRGLLIPSAGPSQNTVLLQPQKYSFQPYIPMQTPGNAILQNPNLVEVGNKLRMPVVTFSQFVRPAAVPVPNVLAERPNGTPAMPPPPHGKRTNSSPPLPPTLCHPVQASAMPCPTQPPNPNSLVQGSAFEYHPFVVNHPIQLPVIPNQTPQPNSNILMQPPPFLHHRSIVNRPIQLPVIPNPTPPPKPNILYPQPDNQPVIIQYYDPDLEDAIALSLITAKNEQLFQDVPLQQDLNEPGTSRIRDTPECRLDEMLTQVIQMFPDADVTHVRTQLGKVLEYDPNPVNFVCNSFLEDPSYPKAKKAEKIPPKPENEKASKVDYLNDWREIGVLRNRNNYNNNYVHTSTMYLMHSFKQISKISIDKVLQSVNFCFLPAFVILNDIVSQEMYKDLVCTKTKGRLVLNIECTLPGTDKTKGKDAPPDKRAFQIFVNRGKRVFDVRLVKNCQKTLKEELEYWEDHVKANREKSDYQLAVSLNQEEYEQNQQLIECECCYDQRPFEDMLQCFECHLFCRECLQSYVREAVYGQGKPILNCMSADCKSIFPRDQLEKALSQEVLDKYDERCGEESVQLAGMDDLVRCPDCNTPAELPSDLKVFHCPKCQKETCRFCKQDWAEHFGKTCKEVESKDEATLRTKYEEKQAEALIRKCHRCKAAIIKTDGCNKMTCRCGAKMCYVCRMPNIDYNHFCQHVRTPGIRSCSMCSSCFLWADMKEEDNAKIQVIESEMKIKQKEKENEKLSIVEQGHS